MLTKKVASTVTSVTRLCQCGTRVTLSATGDETVCGECGNTVHSVQNDTDNINGGTAHETAEHAARDSSTTSPDPK